jgi:hypothetical protein
MEKLQFNRLGQWSLVKSEDESKKPKIVQVPDEEDQGSIKSPYQQMRDAIESTPDKQVNDYIDNYMKYKPVTPYSKYTLRQKAYNDPSEYAAYRDPDATHASVHSPDNWGPVVNIKPDEIAHHSNPMPSEPGEDTYHGKWDYDYVRDPNGRVYQKIFASGPEYGHLNNKYLPTNFHESQRSEEDFGKLSGAEQMGVIFKRANSKLN